MRGGGAGNVVEMLQQKRERERATDGFRCSLAASVSKNNKVFLCFSLFLSLSLSHSLILSLSTYSYLSPRVPMLPDASCLLPPLARHAAATATRPRFGTDDFARPRIVAAAAVELAGAPSWLNAALGPGLQCFEAASLGMPLEVNSKGRGRGGRRNRGPQGQNT